MRRPSVIAPAIAGLVLVLAARLAFAAPAPPTAEELARHVGALTAPEMEGRGSATEGGEQAARYLESALSALGLRPGGDNGTWRQSFVVRRGVRVAPDAALGRSGPAPVSLTVGRDWMPHGGAQAGEVEGELVFVGRGADYASADVRGKIVLLLEGGGTRLEQLIAARHAGAAAALSIGATLPSLDATAARVAIPSAAATPAAVDTLLAPSGWTYATLIQTTQAPTEGAARPAAVPTGVRARLERASSSWRWGLSFDRTSSSFRSPGVRVRLEWTSSGWRRGLSFNRTSSSFRSLGVRARLERTSSGWCRGLSFNRTSSSSGAPESARSERTSRTACWSVVLQQNVFVFSAGRVASGASGRIRSELSDGPPAPAVPPTP